MTASTFPALRDFVRGIRRNSRRPMARNFGVLFDLRLKNWLSKQSWSRWFETPFRPLWHHRNGFPKWSLPGYINGDYQGWALICIIYSNYLFCRMCTCIPLLHINTTHIFDPQKHFDCKLCNKYTIHWCNQIWYRCNTKLDQAFINPVWGPYDFDALVRPVTCTSVNANCVRTITWGWRYHQQWLFRISPHPGELSGI